MKLKFEYTIADISYYNLLAYLFNINIDCQHAMTSTGMVIHCMHSNLPICQTWGSIEDAHIIKLYQEFTYLICKMSITSINIIGT